MTKTFIFLLASLSCLTCGMATAFAGERLSPKLPDGRQRAFPTAEGFGAAAVGGRGGRVIYVTNTAESGPGSLRACIEDKGPRNCVFRVAGTITLNASSLVINDPFITIAGETAPGGGIAIRNSGTQLRPSIEVKSHDVIIRHIRVRPGPHTEHSCCSGAIGLYTYAATDIILDHISASWGSDETVDAWRASNFTWQWGIVSEPLLNGGPGKKHRARNMLFTKSGSMTVHHTLFALGQFRNPQIELAVPDAVADVVNNVMYSRRWKYVISLDDRETHIRANIVGNYKTKAKNTDNDRLVHPFVEDRKGFSIYVKDNYDEPYRTASSQLDDEVLLPEHRKFVVATPFPAPPVRTTSPQKAYEEVLARAGATKPKRDAVDIRIIDAVRNRTGALLKNDPSEVGGWPELEPGTPYSDGDMDGIADTWEASHGLKPEDASDGPQDRNGDGWTNFEEYISELAGD